MHPARLRFGALVAACVCTVLALLAGPTAASATVSPASVVTIDPIGGTPTDVSCPTSSFCMAVDNSGAAVAYHDGSWSAPTVVNPGVDQPEDDYRLDTVSCTSASFCVAIDHQGDAFRWDGTAWASTADATRHSNIASAIDCVSTTFCMAVVASSAITYDGTTWSTPVSADPSSTGRLTAVSCSSSTQCVALDSQGNADVYDGQSWTADPSLFSNVAQVAVSCGPSSCVAVAGSKTATFDGQSWNAATAVPGVTTYFTSISCVADDSCVATDNSGNAFTLANGTWAESAGVDGAGNLAAISCTGDAFCMAVDTWGYATSSGAGGWGTPELMDQDTGGLAAVSCPTDQFCAAVDGSGNALTFDGTAWTAPAIVDPHANLRLVSCASASFCAAAGNTRADAGLLYTYDGVGWTEVPGLPWIDSLSCPTTTFCMGIGAYGEIIRYDGVQWTSAASGLNNFIGPLSCPTASFCSTGNYQWNGQHWTFAQNDPNVDLPTGHPIACSSSTFCAIPDGFYMFVYDGMHWTLTAKSFWSGADSISCPAPAFCAISLGVPGSVRALDNGSAGDEVGLDPAPGGLQSLSCPTIGMCMAVDYTSAVQWLTGRDHPAPAVTTNPAEQTTVPAGTQVSLSAAASGVPDPTVQWQSSPDGTTWSDVPSASSDTLTFSANASGQYRAVFSNPAGTAPSDVANVTVETSPEITKQPVGQAVLYGHEATFTAAAHGTPKPTVSWQRSVDHGAHWSTIPGATARAYSVVAKSPARYRAVFANAIGSTPTSAAKVTVWRKPTITEQPTSRSARHGTVVRFTAAASGTPAPAVAWQVSGDHGQHWTSIGGAAASTLRVHATSAASGREYRARFANVAGVATTHPATLHVT